MEAYDRFLPLLESELKGLSFGEVILRVQVRCGSIHRVEVSRIRSLMVETQEPCEGRQNDLSVKLTFASGRSEVAR